MAFQTPKAAGHWCHECQGCFPTEATLAQHLLEHDMLRKIQAAGVALPTLARQPPPTSKPHANLSPGVVQQYDQAKGFGFLRRPGPGAQQGVVYFHITVCDVQAPAPAVGEAVMFQEEVVAKGPKATRVLRADAAGAMAGGGAVAAVRPPEHVDDSTIPPVQELRGLVQYYNTQDGSGFLSAVNGAGGNLAFHVTNCDVQTPPPRIGEHVRFSLGADGGVTAVARLEANAAPDGARAAPVEPPPAALNLAALVPPKLKYRFDQLAKVQRGLFECGANPRYLFVDFDNVWVSYCKATHLVGVFPGASKMEDLEIDLEGFTRRLGAGAEGSSVARLVAFYFNTPESVMNRLRALNHDGVAWDVRKQETTTDTSMQLELLNSKHPCSSHPKTLVLVTGDGNVAPNGMCFREIMDKYLRDAWSVELHAWLYSTASSYIAYQREYPKVVLIRPFDDENVGEIVRLRGARRVVASRASPAPVATAAPVKKPKAKKSKAKPAPPKAERKPTAVPPVENVAPFDPTLLTAALLMAVQDLRAGTQPHWVPEAATAGRPPVVPPSAAAPPLRAATPPPPTVAPSEVKTYPPERYQRLIEQLEGADGDLFIPTAIALLSASRASVDVASIQELDQETQRLLLLEALNEEMDAATWRFIHAEEAAQ